MDRKARLKETEIWIEKIQTYKEREVKWKIRRIVEKERKKKRR